MVRIRHSDSVKIQISGPRRVIPHTRIEIGRRSMTWKQFVVDVCKIQLDPEVNYFICTAGYSPNHSVEGWTANLNDKIESFVTNYTKKLKKYSVRLHRGRAPQQANHHQISSPTSQPSPPKTEIFYQDNYSSLNVSPQKPILSLAAKKFASISPLKPGQLAEIIKQQNIEKNMVESRNLSDETTVIPPRRGRRKRNKKRFWNESVRVSETKLIVKRNRCKNTPSPPKLMRYDEVDGQNRKNSSSNVGISNGSGTSKKSLQFDKTDDEMIKRESKTTSSFSANNKQEQDEIIIIDLLELDDDDQDLDKDIKNVKYFEKSNSAVDCVSEGEDQFDNLVKSGKFENAAKMIKKERSQCGPEMLDLLARFEQSIDSFDENLLEQIKLEVISLKRNGIWDGNMKRSPLACYLIEEICKA